MIISTCHRLASEPREVSVARLSTTAFLSWLLRIQRGFSVMVGSVWTAWLPLKLQPRNAGTGPFTPLGTKSCKSRRGPSFLPVR